MIHYLIQRKFFCLDFFGDKADVGLGLQGAFQRDMTCGPAHQFDKVPVFFCGIGVPLQIADKFAVSFAGRVKAKRGFDVFVFKVAVDCLGAADNLNAGTLGKEVFGKEGRVGIGIVPADNHHGGKAQLFCGFQGSGKLFVRFNFGPP